MTFTETKIALVFDWMTTPGGAERVNNELADIFPEADIFCSIFDSKKFPQIKQSRVKTSFIQNLPFSVNKHQLYLGFMPYAYELFDLSQYDIVISSSHSCAKGVITKPETMHVCYCHSPMRYAWDNWQKYLKEYKMNGILKNLAKKKLHKIRLWDRLSADRVDYFIANSSITQKRIQKYYRRDSEIIHPPSKLGKVEKKQEGKNYFLALGRLIPYKKFDIIIEAFNKNGLPLKIAGSGISENELRKKANSNIEFLGFVEEEELWELHQGAKALIFPQIEDFGITILEANSVGTPVIAYKGGGALDSISENLNGIFFDEQSSASLVEAIDSFHKQEFDHEKIKLHAKKFDRQNFRQKLTSFIAQKWQEFNS